MNGIYKMTENLREYFARLKIENPEEYERQKEKQKAQYKRNKESRLSYQNKYNDEHKEEIEKYKQKFYCEICQVKCGNPSNYKKHLETKKHQNNLPHP